MSTTIGINKIDLSWWRICCKKLGMTSEEAFSKFRRNVELRKQQEFYNSLPRPDSYCKPLYGIKIVKNYRKK
jgi:hypothetical protein